MNARLQWRKQQARVAGIVCAFAVLSAISGCADENWGYVTGTVTLNGKPVGPGSLMFEPENPVSVTTPSAIAHFREDGKYVLKSAGNREGAPVGTYLVMVHSRGEGKFGDEIVDPNEKSAIPTKYLNHRLSGLKATVEPGKQTINFDLEP